ncbi:hypothetical protein [Achromobacter xylosoxidans]|uniref:hypothetical protein n=1 Tax=Alcaligenes xylosoxydans xylosoxydans TaxID=85698 RepID=UPI00059FA97D|nr:hypothetical protein [Achromobacter xylosoxidans]
MKIQKLARYFVIGLALALAGFVGAVGALTLIFSPATGAYAPVSSSDAASWIQAVGSIIAIVASYWLGERQASKARDHALEIFHLQRTRSEEGSQAVVVQLHKEIFTLKQAADGHEYVDFIRIWKKYLAPTFTATLAAFDNLPHHELGSTRRVMLAFEMRSQVQHVVRAIDEMTGIPMAPGANENSDGARRRIEPIRSIADDALQRQTELRNEFYGTSIADARHDAPLGAQRAP